MFKETAEFKVLLRVARQLKKIGALLDQMDERYTGRKETYEFTNPHQSLRSKVIK